MQRIAVAGWQMRLRKYTSQSSTWLANAPPQLTISMYKALLSAGLVETPSYTSIRAVVGIRATTMNISSGYHTLFHNVTAVAGK